MVGDLASVNGIYQRLVIGRWTTMFNLDTSICIVGHVLVVFHVEYLLAWWHSMYATSLIVPVLLRYHLSWFDSIVYQISSSTMEILICCISSAIMEILIHCISSAFMEIMILCISSSWRFWSTMYCTWRWPHMSYFVSCLLMAIVLLYILDCYMYLQAYAEIFVLHCWMTSSSTWFFIIPLLGWTYNVFRPSYHPSDLRH